VSFVDVFVEGLSFLWRPPLTIVCSRVIHSYHYIATIIRSSVHRCMALAWFCCCAP